MPIYHPQKDAQMKRRELSYLPIHGRLHEMMTIRCSFRHYCLDLETHFKTLSILCFGCSCQYACPASKCSLEGQQYGTVPRRIGLAWDIDP